MSPTSPLAELRTVDQGLRGRPRTRRHVLRRGGVAEALDRAAGASVVVVRGPAGIGKTTAVASWLDEAPASGAWWAVRADRPVDEIWAGVAALLADPAEPTTTASPSTPDLDEVLGRSSAPVTIVLDDVDRAPGPRLADDVERLVLRHDHLHVVLISRVRTPFELAAGADLDVELVSPDVFELSRSEVAAVLTARGVCFDDASLTLVDDTLGGWAVAVQRLAHELALQPRRLWRRRDLAPLVVRLEGELTRDVTAEAEALVGAEALRAAAELPFLSPELLEAVTGDRAAAAELLDVVERSGVGGWIVVGSARRLVLAPVVRRVLLGQPVDDAQRETSRRVQVAGARQLLADGAARDALGLAAAAGDWSLLAEVLERHHAELTRDHADEVLAVLETVPEAQLRDDPWLLCLLGKLTAFRGRSWLAAAGTLAAADSAARELQKDAGPTGSLRLASVRIAALRRAGSVGRAAALARRTRESMAQLRVPRTPELARRLADAHLQIGLSFFHEGAYDEALLEFGAVGRLGEATDPVRLRALGSAALVPALDGRLGEERALVAASEADERWSDWRHTVWALPTHLAAGIAALDAGDDREARRRIRTASSLPSTVEEWPVVTYLTALGHLAEGDGVMGFSVIRDAEAAHPHGVASNHLQGLLTALKSDFLLLSKQARSALGSLRPFVDGRESVAGAHARALLFAGAAADARVVADRMVWRGRLAPRPQLELQLVRALASGRVGDLDVARTALEQAASVSAHHDLRLPWWLVPAEELRALARQAGVDLDPVLADAPRIYSSGLTVPKLTRREAVVLAQLRGVGSVDDIARTLGVSPNTVKSQVRSLYRKLGVSTRPAALRVAYEWRLLAPVAREQAATA